MKLIMIRHKNETEVLLLSITKNCETPIEQTHRTAEETLEIKMNKTKGTFHSRPLIQIQGSWMAGLTDLEVYNSVFNITEENIKFALYKFPDEKAGGFTYEKSRDEIERDLDISDITATDLQDDIICPIIIEEYREQVTKRMEDEQYKNILSIYTTSVFQDFEGFLRTQIHLQDFEGFIRTQIDLVEDDSKLVLDKYNSSFITYELQPVIYTFKDISEVLLNFLQSEYKGVINKIDIEYDDIAMKTKLNVRLGIITVRFDE